MPFLARALFAVGFIVLCVLGTATWFVGAGAPWWMPFVAAVAVPTVLGVAATIINGRDVWRD